MEPINNVFILNIDDFIGPDRRMDAFPSVRYDIPRTYRSDSIMLSCAVDSPVACVVEGKYVYLDINDLLLVSPYALHEAHTFFPEGTILNVVLRPSMIKNAFPRILENDNPMRYFFLHCMEKNGPLYLHLKTSQITYDTALIPAIVDYCIYEKKPDKNRLLSLEASLEAMLLDILFLLPDTEFSSHTNTGEGDSLSRIFGYLQRHLSDATLSSTANELGWNASHLSRYLKAQTGRSFTEFTRVLRLDEAASLLLHTDLSIDEIMLRTGYTGRTHFYSLFTDRFRNSPGEYRRLASVSAQAPHPDESTLRTKIESGEKL